MQDLVVRWGAFFLGGRGVGLTCHVPARSFFAHCGADCGGVVWRGVVRGGMRARPKKNRYELTQFNVSLDIANVWRERLGLGRNTTWDKVRLNLAPLPVTIDPAGQHTCVRRAA